MEIIIKCVHRIWARYGVAGPGLLSPLFFGAPMGTALGIVIWSIGLTLAGALGLASIEALWN